MSMRKTATCKQGFKTKKLSDGSTIVEGWANAGTVDRTKEIILEEAWSNLDNYKKTGVILFNHDPDKPIGKMLEIRGTDKGLWLKAKISKSKDPFVSYIRDLVEEGVLNAFSVGFDPIDEQKNQDGIVEVKSLDLYEVSVVTLPANQDSIFTLSSKSFKGLEYKDVKKQILRQKGAMVAAAAQDKLSELEKAGELDKDKLVQMLVEKAGVDAEQAAAILAGNVTPVPEPVLVALAEILGLDVAELQKMDATDAQEEGEKSKKSDDQKEEPAEPEQEKSKSDKSAVGVTAILIPKDAVADAEAAAAWAKENGWEAGEVTEDDSNFIVAQGNRDEFGEGETAVDLGDGVTALVGVKKPGEKSEEPEEAKSMDDPEEEKAADCEDTKEADPEKEKAAMGGASDGLPNMDENPMYQQVRQTNVLLGALIDEIKGMSAKMDKLVVTEPGGEPEEVEEEELETDEEKESTQKMLADARNQLANMRERLRQYTN